jgi:hypothetical protein
MTPMGRFSCNVDSNGNPFQDCLNIWATACEPSSINGNVYGQITECHNIIDVVFRSLNIHWQKIRKNVENGLGMGLLDPPTVPHVLLQTSS